MCHAYVLGLCLGLCTRVSLCVVLQYRGYTTSARVNFRGRHCMRVYTSTHRTLTHACEKKRLSCHGAHHVLQTDGVIRPKTPMRLKTNRQYTSVSVKSADLHIHVVPLPLTSQNIQGEALVFQTFYSIGYNSVS